MRKEKHHKIGFFDVDRHYKLSIQSVARFFQEIAVSHSTSVGVGPDVLSEKGVGWFLNRLEIEFFRYPVLGEDIKITTWSRGFKRYKAYRDYRIESSQGEIARGSSIWIFFDFKQNRISKIPVQICDLYEVDKEKYFDKEIDVWKTCGKIDPEKQMDISLRYSDFDVNGHVNNTIYLGFLETLYHKTMNTMETPIKNIKIRFNREIGNAKESIRCGWQKTNGVYQCNIFDDETLYADARIVPMD